ncbi:BTAD domain-containing putative transcriptional regulator [Streptomyces sp. NBC_00334]|uniref:BTAD domain-containing putative transcriptional regulator n=1 Tax=Streptomyces sp. NBC_00334 TaxID=2975713 RepID=UPI002E2DD4A0|nr:BTAD domain-containing putative transcriptional regulator [Streptomyces sp. NBC_00334]
MLGPVVVRHGRESLDLGPRQRRLLLTRLLIENGRPVSLTELCHSLWGEDQPTAAVSSIRAHISRLRSVLDPARKGRSPVLVSGTTGYALSVPREARDTAAFDAHVARARNALAREQLPSARVEINMALDLWRGPALGEAAELPFALRESARLNAARQDARELLTTILITQGDLLPAVSVAEQLTIGAPLREASWSLLMRALYAAGRPVEALRQYDRFRAMLARELGLDPSPGLRDLHIAVLRHDTATLGLPRPPRTATALSGPPPLVRTPLVGRKEETARLGSLLREAATGHARWAVVSGGPGSGKTRLLDEFAAQASEAGFAVTRAGGGHALGPGSTVSLRCAVAQLADGLRRPGEDADVHDENPDPLTALVRQITRVPTLCVVDDLDWATLDIHHQLRRLARLLRDVPVVVVCALRDTESPAVSGLLAELARLGTAWLRLDPLSTEDVAEVLVARGEDGSAGPSEELHRRSEGNPFVLGELLKLPPAQRTGPDARVPDAIRSVVQARLGELTASARTMLTYAAVDAGRLDLALLADVQRLTHEQVLRLVDEAATKRLVVWAPDSTVPSGGHYRLPDLVHDVLLGTLTASSRHLLHSAIARELTCREDIDPARLDDHLRAAGPVVPPSVPGRTVRPRFRTQCPAAHDADEFRAIG